MKKCIVCAVCSWIVGLSMLGFVVIGLGGWKLPSGGVVNLVYAALGLITLGFLYYQVVPCQRCVAVNKLKATDATNGSAGEMEE